MDQELARIYGTPGAATDEDLEKVAEAELFAKLAANEGVDLNQFNDEQIAELYAATFGKTAEEAPSEGHEKKETAKDEAAEEAVKKEAEKKEAEKKAAAEFAEVQDWQEKVAQFDKLGRIMAHSYVQELGLIGRELEKRAAEETPAEEKKEEKAEEKAEEKKEEKKEEPKKEEEKTSAIDRLAAEKAVEKAAQAGYDPEVAVQRINAVYTLGGPAASEKLASARTLDDAVEIRALEILQTAGYPVQWA